jgi:hypothetical protein
MFVIGYPTKIFNSLPVLLAISLLSFCSLAYDEPNVIIAVDDSIPPNFRFEGNGSIPFFVVQELPPGFSSPNDMKNARIIWRIRPKDYSHGQLPIARITYGSIPDGFEQIEPSSGTPTQLEEGKTYQAGGPSMEMPKGYLRFTVQNGKVVRVK